MDRTFLVLASGEVYSGLGFGYAAPTIDDLSPGILRFSAVGEVVFNTAMVGYHEVLTDPSYTGQLVLMTYPHMGNYGSVDQWSESGRRIDSNDCETDPRPVKAAGFVLRSLYRGPVPKGRITLDAFLKNNQIPGITEIDTRKLTIRLRDHGSTTGVLVRSKFSQSMELSKPEIDGVVAYLNSYPKMEGLNLVSDVGTLKSIQIPKDLPTDSLATTNTPRNDYSIALVDCGVKANIVREFTKLGCNVIQFPSTAGAQDILDSNPDGIMISNGPGDPAVLTDQVELIKQLIGKKPVFGICLGHQLISQALGAKTFKMKFGHHGINHPVRDEFTKKVFVTSQNHGFAVDDSTLPKDVDVWFKNANDGTNEGIRSDELGLYTAQFHPESAPGPYDSHWIFEAFLKAIPEFQPGSKGGK